MRDETRARVAVVGAAGSAAGVPSRGAARRAPRTAMRVAKRRCAPRPEGDAVVGGVAAAADPDLIRPGAEAGPALHRSDRSVTASGVCRE
jgi:hypothetical protein